MSKAEEGSSQVVEARNKQSREAYQDRAAALLEKMPEGLRSSLANVLHPGAGEVLRMLSEEVAARMGGSDPKIARKTSRHLKTLKKDQGHKIIMIGDIRFGVCRHRCLLFKVCCERVTSVRCTLERPSNGRDLLHGTHAWNVVEIPRSSGPVRAVCDLMEAPGLLLDASHHRTLVQDWHEYGLFGGELPEDAFVNKAGEEFPALQRGLKSKLEGRETILVDEGKDGELASFLAHLRQEVRQGAHEALFTLEGMRGHAGDPEDTLTGQSLSATRHCGAAGVELTNSKCITEKDRLESEAPEVMLDGAQGAEGEDGLREEAPPQAGLHMAAKQAGQEEVEEEEKEEEVQETQEVLKTQAQREKHASMRRAREELEQRRIELAQQCERRAHEADAEARQSWLQVVMKAEDGWFMNAPDPPSIAPEAKVDAEQERQWRAWDEGLAKKEADTVASSRRWAQAVMHTLDYMEKPYRKAEWGFDEDAYMEMAEETPEVAEVAEVAEVPEVSDVNEPVAAICASPFVSQETLRRASLEARPPEATASEMRKPMPGLKLDIPSPSGGSPTSSPAPSSSTAAAGALAASRGTQLVAPRPPSPQCSARTSSAPAGDVAAKSKPPGRLAMMLKKKGAINRAWPSLGKVLQKSQGSEGGKNPMSNLQQLVRDALLAKTAADSEPRELKLSGDLLTGNALNELTKRVAMQATLETLELRSNGLTMAAGPHAPMSRLCGALQAALVLRRLVIVDNNLQDSGTAAVCRALTNNTTLEHLVLSSCNLNGEAVGALVPLLKLGHSRLSHLDLSQNRLCGAGFAALGKALPYASSLRKLTLAGNAVGVEGMRGLAVGLAQNTTITTLNLDDCSLYGCAEDRKEDPGVVWELGGIEALAATVGDHPSLTALHLAGNNLGGLRVLEGISVDDVMGGQGRVGETVEYQ
eukprot:gene9965-11798_t